MLKYIPNSKAIDSEPKSFKKQLGNHSNNVKSQQLVRFNISVPSRATVQIQQFSSIKSNKPSKSKKIKNIKNHGSTPNLPDVCAGLALGLSNDWQSPVVKMTA